MNISNRLIYAFALLAVVSICAVNPAYADALDIAAQKVGESKEKVKTIVIALIAVASIIGIGGAVWALFVQRSTAAIVAAAVGLGVAGIALAVLASL